MKNSIVPVAALFVLLSAVAWLFLSGNEPVATRTDPPEEADSGSTPSEAAEAWAEISVPIESTVDDGNSRRRHFPGSNAAQAVEARLFEANSVRTAAANEFIGSDDFEAVLAALSQQADPTTRNASRDHRARLEAALRTDPRFTVAKFACSRRFCLATISGRGVPKAEAFENMLFTSKAKPVFYAAINASSDELNANHDRMFRLFFATDPRLNSFVIDPAADGTTQDGSNTR